MRSAFTALMVTDTVFGDFYICKKFITDVSKWKPMPKIMVPLFF